MCVKLRKVLRVFTFFGVICHSNWLITKTKKLNLGGIMFHELKVEYIPINRGVPWFGPIIGKQKRWKDQMTNVKLDIGSDFKHNLRRKL
jgi:hypothetical protein